MGFRNPITTAADPTARAAAAAAQTTANQASTAAGAAQTTANQAITAGQQAQTTANTALTAANGKNTIYLAATQPAAPAGGFSTDDTWIDTGNGNRLNVWNGTAWTLQTFGTGAIAAGAVTAAVIAANTITAAQLAAGAVTAATVAAGAIDGQVITGATLRTAASGQRVQIDSANGLIAYNPSGQAVTQVRPSDGTLTAAGAQITGRLDTTAGTAARTSVYETTNPDTLAPSGIVEFSDGITGNTAARIIQTSIPNPRSVTIPVGRLAIKGGAYAAGASVVTAPELYLSVEQNAAGQPVKVARWAGADRIIPSQNYIATASATTARAVASTGWTSLILDSLEANDGGFSINPGTSQLVVPWDGWYEVSAVVPFAASTAGYRALRWNWTKLTGSAQLSPRVAAWDQPATTGGNTVVAQPIPIKMPAGGWVELQAAAGTAISTAINTDGVPQVSIKLLAPL